MVIKLSSNIDYFEDSQLLGLVSQLKDYRLAFFVNNQMGFNFKKYSNLDFYSGSGKKKSASWYYYYDEQLSAKMYLIGNSTDGGKLIPSKKEIDYFLLFKEFQSTEYADSTLSKLRAVSNVLAVFKLDLNNIKEADILMEQVELHEIEQVLKPQRQDVKKHDITKT
jgi:hypothetical protein